MAWRSLLERGASNTVLKKLLSHRLPDAATVFCCQHALLWKNIDYCKEDPGCSGTASGGNHLDARLAVAALPRV